MNGDNSCRKAEFARGSLGVDFVGCPPPVARVAAKESSSAAPRGRSRYVFADTDVPNPGGCSAASLHRHPSADRRSRW